MNQEIFQTLIEKEFFEPYKEIALDLQSFYSTYTSVLCEICKDSPKPERESSYRVGFWRNFCCELQPYLDPSETWEKFVLEKDPVWKSQGSSKEKYCKFLSDKGCSLEIRPFACIGYHCPTLYYLVVHMGLKHEYDLAWLSVTSMTQHLNKAHKTGKLDFGFDKVYDRKSLISFLRERMKTAQENIEKLKRKSIKINPLEKKEVLRLIEEKIIK